MERQGPRAFLAVFEGDPFGGDCRVVRFDAVGAKRRTKDDDRAFRKRVRKRRAKKGYR